MHEEQLTIASADDHTIHATIWYDDESPRRVIQLFHGLGEHRGRYKRFAKAVTKAGMALVCHDHRGHGEHRELAGYFADQDGWRKLLADGHRVNDKIRSRFADTPIVLIGHSMGSYIAQAFVMQHPDRIDALVLSASTWPERSKVAPGRLLAKFFGVLRGRRTAVATLDTLGFGGFNRPFEPGRTDLDWLSRDDAEVERYIADPLCGGPYTAGLWIDLLGGLLDISRNHSLEKIRSDLPILLTAGDKDPVGGAKGVGLLAKHYAETGHDELAVRLYEDGRHEMFNETNRDAFTENLIGWIDKLELDTATNRSLRSD